MDFDDLSFQLCFCLLTTKDDDTKNTSAIVLLSSLLHAFLKPRFSYGTFNKNHLDLEWMPLPLYMGNRRENGTSANLFQRLLAVRTMFLVCFLPDHLAMAMHILLTARLGLDVFGTRDRILKANKDKLRRLWVHIREKAPSIVYFGVVTSMRWSELSCF